MNLSRLGVDKLIDPSTYVGAVALAFIMSIAAWAGCAIATRIVHLSIDPVG